MARTNSTPLSVVARPVESASRSASATRSRACRVRPSRPAWSAWASRACAAHTGWRVSTESRYASSAAVYASPHRPRNSAAHAVSTCIWASPRDLPELAEPVDRRPGEVQRVTEVGEVEGGGGQQGGLLRVRTRAGGPPAQRVEDGPAPGEGRRVGVHDEQARVVGADDAVRGVGDLRGRPPAPPAPPGRRVEELEREVGVRRPPARWAPASSSGTRSTGADASSSNAPSSHTSRSCCSSLSVVARSSATAAWARSWRPAR